MRSPRQALRRIAIFALTTAALWTAILGASWRPGAPRAGYVDFNRLAESEVVVTTGLTRRERAALGLEFLEHGRPPKVAMFGNHMFQYFSRSAFGEVPDDYYLNLYYGNLSLTELFALLRYLEEKGRLPRETIVLQVTPPNNDNGLHLLGFAGELPLPLIRYVLDAEWREGPYGLIRLWSTLSEAFSGLVGSLYYQLSYSTFFESLRPEARWTLNERIFDIRSCESTALSGAPTPSWHRFAPGLLKQLLENIQSGPTAQVRCEAVHLANAIRRDGSAIAKYDRKSLILNENPLDPREADASYRKVQGGDEEEIALYLRRIAAVAARNRIQIAFVIPPVYETEREGPGDRALSGALALAPELTVLDHRKLRGRKEFFVTYDHPSGAYFEMLVAELRALRLIES